MGQLEKYGLYVMCLVIFLILGVTLWGEPATARSSSARQNAAIHAGMTGSANARPVRRRASMDDLLSASRERPARAVSRRAEGLGSLLDDEGGGSAKPAVKEPTVKPAPAVPAAQKVATDSAGKPAKKPQRQPAAKMRTYTVKDGDDLTRIALRQLGKSSRWPLIVEVNPDLKNPDRLQVGMQLRLPNVAVKSGSSGRNASAVKDLHRTYKIRKGDSYSLISQKFFGTVKRAAEIKNMNPNVPEHRMKIGREIKVPRK